jgi:DNA-binding CsgD family transcriptional regulator
LSSDGQRPPRIDGLVEDITSRKQSEAGARAAAVAAAQVAMLSPRERQVLSHVVAGEANKVVARRLDISEKTVEKHRASLMKKMNVRNVADLVRVSMLAGVVADELGNPPWGFALFRRRSCILPLLRRVFCDIPRSRARFTRLERLFASLSS